MNKIHITLDLLRKFATDFKRQIDVLLNNKVDKVDGKQLSTEDYTAAEKNKLKSLSNYTLPKASSTILGGVKVGAGLTIDTDGNLSATGGGEADSVNWENVVGKPDKLSQFTNDSDFQTAENVDSKLVDYAKKTDIASVYKYKGSKANYAALPTSGNIVGDVWNIEAADSTNNIKAGDNVAWTGTEWDNLGGNVDLSSYALKSELPTKNSQLTNDSGFQTSAQVETIVNGKMTSKVDKEDGKGLSTNDFTNEYKDKLDNLENITIDFATTSDIDNIINEVFA